MADPQGFLKYDRELPILRPPKERVKDYREFHQNFPTEKNREQASRCMDCGVPFCHSGCPLGNVIPEFNDAVYRENWEEAYQILSKTNNFPEFTGRICPAPCEAACVLSINQLPVAIEHIEKSIAEKAFELGLVKVRIPKKRTGKKVAVIGSGPAGLAAADQLNQAGHQVTVFERNDRLGGLLRYGIPDFKLEKQVLDRRLEVMEKEGIRFRENADVGGNVEVDDLLSGFDALVLCGGATIARDLPIPGRHLKGVHFAMDYLEQINRQKAGETIPPDLVLSAKGKNVVVIGGGDTGSDCIGTSNRQAAASVTQIELLGKPPAERSPQTPWPLWPMKLQTSSSHEEGCNRQWAILTKEFIGNEKDELTALRIVDVNWEQPANGGRAQLVEIEGTQREIPCEFAFLAIGFVHPKHKGLLEKLGVELDNRGNVKSQNFQTNVEKVFVAGDMHRGQSLVVWAIAEGREAAAAVCEYVN